MKIFLCLLAVISGYLLISSETYFISLALILFISIVTIVHFRSSKKFILILISIFIVALIYRNLNFQTFQNQSNFTGIVIKQSDNYVIVTDGIEKFYVKIKGEELGMFSIVKIDGTYGDYVSHTIESSFDFQKYLNNQGIFRQIYVNSYTTQFNSFINCSRYQNFILSRLTSEESKNIIASLILNKTDQSSSFYKQNFTNLTLFLFSFSGLFLSSFIRTFEKILKFKLKENTVIFIISLILINFLFLNMASLTLHRLLVLYALKLGVNFAHKKNKLLSIERTDLPSITYLVLLIDKRNIYSFSLIIPLLISSLNRFINYSKVKNKFYKFLLQKGISLLIFIPFYLEFNNAINLFSILENIIILPVFQALFIYTIPIMFGLKMPFIEEIYNFVFKVFVNSELKYFNFNAPPLNQYGYIFYYALFILFMYFFEVRNKRVYPYILGFIFSITAIYFVPFDSLFTSSVTFINIGQGDSTLIRKNGETYLIDTGGSLTNDLAINSLIPYFRKNRIYKIDNVFITHYDTDHYYALESLKKYFLVNNVYDYNNINTYNGNLNIHNLNVFKESIVDENSKSLVLRFELGGKTFMVMGDAPMEIEKKIIENNKNLETDILKVGHHGSKTSSCLEFLKATNPEVAIISCGYKNRYGHPNKEVIENLNKLNINIRRTDLEGTIKYTFLG